MTRLRAGCVYARATLIGDNHPVTDAPHSLPAGGTLSRAPPATGTTARIVRSRTEANGRRAGRSRASAPLSLSSPIRRRDRVGAITSSVAYASVAFRACQETRDHRAARVRLLSLPQRRSGGRLAGGKWRLQAGGSTRQPSGRQRHRDERRGDARARLRRRCRAKPRDEIGGAWISRRRSPPQGRSADRAAPRTEWSAALDSVFRPRQEA